VDHRREVHKWLATSDPMFNYTAALKKRNDSTGAWFMESRQYASWIDDENSFLWLYGIPGCGKTILTTTAIENVSKYCDRRTGCAIAYFYFDFNDKDKQLHGKMIRSILKQLSAQSPETPQPLTHLYTSCEDMDRQPTRDELIDTLRQVIYIFYDVYIIIDALDECSEVMELMDVLAQLKSWNISHLHLLVSSRPDRVIEVEMGHIVEDDAKLSIQSNLIQSDIRIYIRGRLDTDNNLKRWQKRLDVQSDIESTLMGKADGMFRLVVCQLDELGKCFTRPQLNAGLSSLPKSLDDMYARMLARIPEEHEVHAVKILQWLTHSLRPLRIEEVAEALAVDVDDEVKFDIDRRFADPRDILRICSGLTIAPQIDPEHAENTKQADQMQVAHSSVKEFLMSERAGASALRYRVVEEDAHTAIAEDCLGYLLSFDQPGSLNPDVLQDFHLAEYAAQHWLEHARKGKYGGKIIQFMQKLFQSNNPAYMNWLCIYNPDKPWQGPLNSLPTPPEPLYIASLCGLLEIVSSLLDNGADLTTAGGECGYALQAACRGGHDDVVERLLEGGANVNSQGGLYGTSLHAASFWGHERVVERLLKAGADISMSCGKYARPLIAAAQEGHLEVASILLKAGAAIDAQGGFYGSALQAAAFHGHEQVLKFLLSEGADANLQAGEVYGNALQAASRNGYDQIVRDLLEAGAQVNTENGMYLSALQSAARGAQGQVIQLLLDAGAEPNLKGGKYGSALQAACLTDNDQVVQQLLDAGADVNGNAKGVYGNALQAACAQGHEKVVKILLHAGAQVNIKGGHHKYPILAAADNGHDHLVELLLGTGANVKGRKLRLADSIPNFMRITQMLRDAGAIFEDSNLPLLESGIHRQCVSAITEDLDEMDMSSGSSRKSSLTVKFCDECGKPIPNGAQYYHCKICLDDDWDTCEDCVKSGFPCRNRTHKLVKYQMIT
jgi:ankyrin repeat protein